MKANGLSCKDLMVGDWVYNTHNRQNERVQEITSGLVMLDYNDLYDYDEIEPIPLTPEILEKNGYIKDGYFYKKGEYDRIQLGQLFEHASVVCYKDMRFCEVSTSPYLLQYVHQLQHAMRLCGIEKEIIL